MGSIDSAKRAALFIKLNDLVVSDNDIQPIISHTRVAALGGNRCKTNGPQHAGLFSNAA